MQKLSPQCKAIFDHLLRGGTISTLEAMRDFGCCRLSERVREIEATGIEIDRERIAIGKKHYTRYSYHTAGYTMLPLTKRDIAWAEGELERLHP